MADEVITALRSENLSALRTAIHVNPEAARHPRVMVEAAQRAFQPAVAFLQRNGADLNASYRNHRPLHVLLQEDPHGEGRRPSRERLACLDWLLANGADPEQLGVWPSARAIIIAAFASSRICRAAEEGRRQGRWLCRSGPRRRCSVWRARAWQGRSQWRLPCC